MLNPEQLSYFETFGFVILRHLFSSEEMRTISKEFETGLDAAYRHEPFARTKRQWTTLLGPETPFYASLLEEDRFFHIAEQIYGHDVLGMAVDANRYVGSTGWHPDHDVDPAKDCYGVKFAFYLEPVGAETGALRVIPGSHKNPLHTEVRATIARTKPKITDLPGFVCESEPGDVVAFDMRCWHASWGGTDGRRMSTAVYYNNPKSSFEEEATRKRARSNARTPAQYRRPNDPLYHPHWIENPSNNPRRQRWILRLRELGFLDPPIPN